VSSLLTGFAPFAGAEVNPSWIAAGAVAQGWTSPEQLHIAVLPVEFGAAAVRMDELIDEHKPDTVVAVGLAAGRDRVSLERVAINVDDARIPDNAGHAPIDRPIIEDGPAAYFSTLPIKAAVAAVQAAGIPAQVSQSAGTFVCNHVFYLLMHAAQSRGGIRAGFVHVPLATEFAGRIGDAGAAGQPTMPIADIATALAIIVRTSIEVRIDAALPGGALH
jgi:pyroglutamyl-peptidase